MMASASTITEHDDSTIDDSRLEQLELTSAQNRQSVDALVVQMTTLESRLDEARSERNKEMERVRLDRDDVARQRGALDAQLKNALSQLSALTDQMALIERERDELQEKCLSLETRQIVQVHRETSTSLSPPPPAITGNLFN